MSFDVEMAWRAYRHYAPSMIHYLESNGYSTTYIMQQDLEDKGPQVLRGHKVRQGGGPFFKQDMGPFRR